MLSDTQRVDRLRCGTHFDIYDHRHCAVVCRDDYELRVRRWYRRCESGDARRFVHVLELRQRLDDRYCGRNARPHAVKNRQFVHFGERWLRHVYIGRDQWWHWRYGRHDGNRRGYFADRPDSRNGDGHRLELQHVESDSDLYEHERG